MQGAKADDTVLPPDYQPAQADVLCGNQREFFFHEGNEYFRQAISNCARSYIAAKTRQEKIGINVDVVHKILERCREEGAQGFIVCLTKSKSKDPSASTSNKWRRMTYAEAKDKCGHAIRKCAKVYEIEHPEEAARLKSQKALLSGQSPENALKRVTSKFKKRRGKSLGSVPSDSQFSSSSSSVLGSSEQASQKKFKQELKKISNDVDVHDISSENYLSAFKNKNTGLTLNRGEDTRTTDNARPSSAASRKSNQEASASCDIYRQSIDKPTTNNHSSIPVVTLSTNTGSNAGSRRRDNADLVHGSSQIDSRSADEHQSLLNRSITQCRHGGTDTRISERSHFEIASRPQTQYLGGRIPHEKFAMQAQVTSTPMGIQSLESSLRYSNNAGMPDDLQAIRVADNLPTQSRRLVHDEIISRRFLEIEHARRELRRLENELTIVLDHVSRSLPTRQGSTGGLNFPLQQDGSTNHFLDVSAPGGYHPPHDQISRPLPRRYDLLASQSLSRASLADRQRMQSVMQHRHQMVDPNLLAMEIANRERIIRLSRAGLGADETTLPQTQSEISQTQSRPTAGSSQYLELSRRSSMGSSENSRNVSKHEDHTRH